MPPVIDNPSTAEPLGDGEPDRRSAIPVKNRYNLWKVLSEPDRMAVVIGAHGLISVQRTKDNHYGCHFYRYGMIVEEAWFATKGLTVQWLDTWWEWLNREQRT